MDRVAACPMNRKLGRQSRAAVTWPVLVAGCVMRRARRLTKSNLGFL